MTVSGPFFFPDSIDFKLLKEFLEKVKEEEPHIVIMTGPFLDIKNECVSSGEIIVNVDGVPCYMDYEQTFEEMMKIIEVETRKLEDTIIYIVPSLNDAHHPYPYPQPEYEYMPKSKKIRLVSNPSQIRINSELRIAVTSNDFLVDVVKQSYVKDNTGSKFPLALKETLNQRLFYPVYPASIMLDTNNYDKIEFDEIPNIVIYTSVLASSIKIVKDTVFLNQGSLFKAGGGTYSKILVSNEVKKPIADRTCVEIKKL